MVLSGIGVSLPAHAGDVATEAEAKAECVAMQAATASHVHPSDVITSPCTLYSDHNRWGQGGAFAYCYSGHTVWSEYGYDDNDPHFWYSPCVTFDHLGPPPPVDPEKNRGEPKCPCKGIGDPIHPGTGSKYDRLVLFKGQGAFPIDLSISYDSTSGVSGALTRPVMGVQRSHSYMRNITVGGGSNYAYALREDGKTYTFRRQGNAWTGDADLADQLQAQYANDGSISSWIYRTENADVETYDSDGRLATITRAGLTQRLTRDASGRIDTVSDPEGRQIRFGYRSDSFVDHIDTPDGTISFQYDERAFLYNRLTILKRITWPDQTHRDYLYNESSGGSSLFPYDLTGVVDEMDRRIDNTTYDDQQRVIADKGPDITGSTTLSYGVAPDGASRITITNPSGDKQQIDLIALAGVPLPSRMIRSCDGCTTQDTAYIYDSTGHLTKRTEPNGSVTTFTYDDNGLVLSSTRAAGTPDATLTATSWDVSLRKPVTRTMTDASGRIVEKQGWAYNAAGNVTAECLIDNGKAPSYVCSDAGVAAAGVRRTVTTYCETVNDVNCPLVGIPLSVDGPRTDVADTTIYRYYMTADESGCATAGGACHRAGDLYQTIDAAGHTATILAYDKAGRIVRQSDANGIITDLAYTPRGWLTRRTVRANADGTPSNADAVTTMAYDPTGTLHSVTDPDNVTVTYGYDDAHRLTDITDGQGNRIHYTLDAEGNRTKEETLDASHTIRRSVTRTYNSLGQLVTVKDGLGQTVFDASADGSYDANGNLVQSRGALGAIHQDVVDALNRVVTSIDNANGADLATKDTTNQYVFDALDRLTTVTDPDGLATHYGFDGFGNPSSLQSPDTGSSSATFDAAGNTLTKTDAKGITVTNTYDALNRLVSASYVDTRANAAYHFDEANSVTGCAASYPQGRLTRVVESAVTTTFCYNFQGQVTEKRQAQGAMTDTVSYVHTRAGRLAAIGTPSGAVTEYSRDALGQIISVTVTPAQGTATPVVTAATYLPFGPIASYTLGNGQTITRSYDANYRATDVVSPALNLHFSRDTAGNIVALGDAAGANPASETYKYDPLYRLTSVNDPSNSAIETYTYNKTGDRLSKTASGLATGAYKYQTGTHWLVGIGTATRTYDLAGSMTGSASAGDAWGYGYDGRGRLSLVQENGSTVAVYNYNAMGQRVAKQTGMTMTRFLYGEKSQLIGERSSINRDYIWLDTTPIGVADQAGIAYIHADELDTPRVLSDGLGRTVWSWSSHGNPFGEIKPTSNVGYVFNLRFPGQYFDAQSGLNYNVNRDYEAATGRYIQSDPIGLLGGASTYGYVKGNPLSAIDPLGLCDEDDRCRRVKNDAIEECSQLFQTPRMDQGFKFHRCVNDYLERNNCGPGGRPLPQPDPSPAIPPPDPDAAQRAITWGAATVILVIIGGLISATP